MPSRFFFNIELEKRSDIVRHSLVPIRDLVFYLNPSSLPRKGLDDVVFCHWVRRNRVIDVS